MTPGCGGSALETSLPLTGSHFNLLGCANSRLALPDGAVVLNVELAALQLASLPVYVHLVSIPGVYLLGAARDLRQGEAGRAACALAKCYLDGVRTGVPKD